MWQLESATSRAAVRLPVRGITLDMRLPSGEEDLLLLETTTSEPALAARLLARLSPRPGGAQWSRLPVADVEAALLQLRQATIGDLLRADVRCTAEGCRARVDIAFRIGELLAYSAPRTPRYVEPSEVEGWYRLRDSDVTFRVPTLGDQLAVVGLKRPEQELARLCIGPHGASGRLVRRAQAAMEVLAPCLSQPLEGVCAECHARMAIHFDVYGFVLRELRQQAASIYQDVHLIAQRYHWSESRILAMPSTRRRQYAEMILDDTGP